MKAKHLVGTIVTGIVLFVGINQVGDSNTVIEDTVVGNETEVLGIQAVEDVAATSEPEAVDNEFTQWASEMNVMLSEPLDDPKLKEANNNEGYEYYLKAKKVVETYPNYHTSGYAEYEDQFNEIYLQYAQISHFQFVRTSHLDPTGMGLATESSHLSRQWRLTDDNMRKPFAEMKRLMKEFPNNKGVKIE
jgi:hypothetical protein